jgi:hypothetical protein
LKKLEDELENLIDHQVHGIGLADQEARRQHEQKIELLKFKITQRDKMRVAVVSALIAALVSAVVNILMK